jgi:AraC-like DNA-binding protein
MVIGPSMAHPPPGGLERWSAARDVPPSVAAAEAGFADQAHLTRWFRRYYGVTPGAYRSALHLQAGES